MENNTANLNTLDEVFNHIRPWLSDEITRPDIFILIETAKDDSQKVLQFRTHRDPEELMPYLTASQDVAMIFQLDSDQTCILPNGEIMLDMFEMNF